MSVFYQSALLFTRLDRVKNISTLFHHWCNQTTLFTLHYKPIRGLPCRCDYDLSGNIFENSSRNNELIGELTHAFGRCSCGIATKNRQHRAWILTLYAVGSHCLRSERWEWRQPGEKRRDATRLNNSNVKISLTQRSPKRTLNRFIFSLPNQWRHKFGLNDKNNLKQIHKR